MSLKDALTKRNAANTEQDQVQLAEPERERIPSLNDPIRPYSVSPDQVLNQKPTKVANRIVTIGDCVVLKGDISDCDRVEVSGQFEGNIKAGSIQISEGGSVKGTLECEELSIAGTVEGKVTSTKTLDINANGKLTGEILYEELIVTSGGAISGSMDKHSNGTPKLAEV
ncbi:MAG: bactofilin family protein [Alphaproteobacteria bacterium]